jgi:hypothetical protein
LEGHNLTRTVRIDYDLVHSQGYAQPVPVKMELHIIRHIISKRQEALEADRNILIEDRWDHSDVFYAARTHLNRNGWDTSIYNGKNGASERRKQFYDKIKGVCEEYFKKRRHELGIFPKDRAVMTYDGSQYTVNYHNLQDRMSTGTYVNFVEKQGTVVKMSPFAEGTGVAFIDSEGFGSEYSVALARLCDQQKEVAQIYTADKNGKYYYPRHKGHLSTLTDCDVSGIVIAIKVEGAIRIGLDLNSIEEINNVNPG